MPKQAIVGRWQAGKARYPSISTRKRIISNTRLFINQKIANISDLDLNGGTVSTGTTSLDQAAVRHA